MANILVFGMGKRFYRYEEQIVNGDNVLAYIDNGKSAGGMYEERPQYLFLDLMEERHNLLERDGAIWTKSDALLESDFALDGWREIP